MRASSAAARPFASLFQPIFCILLTLLIVMSASVSLAQIGVSPATEKFSSQLVTTTSASKSVTLTNNGASAQAFVVTMSGDFAQSNTCGGTIAGSGGVCTVKVTFTPTLSGSIKGAMSVYDNSNNLLAFVGLSGTGEAPVTTSPSSLSFTGGTVGTISAAKTVKITNNTTTSVTITSITTNVPDYTISTGTCLTTPLATKGSNCLVTVQVTPSSAADDGAIIITDNLAIDNAEPVVVKLTSAATGGATPPISLSKTTLAFKTFNGTTSAAQTITVTNTSGGSVTIGTITATTDYSILNNGCTSALAAGAKCTFQIEFSPTFVGSIEGSVAVPFTPSSNASPQIVNVNGTSEAALTNSPASITFKSQGVGTTSNASKVTLTNNSGSAITLSNIAISADFGIQLTGTTCSLTGGALNSGKNCVLEVQISPTITGAIEGAITITNTGSPNPLIIGLAGTGTNTASAALNPSSAHQGTAETILVTGTNTNFGPTTTVSFGADITVGTITVNGPTSLSVPITIDNVATVGSRSATFTTGAQVVNGSFTVVAGVPVVTVINPNTIQPTQTEAVAITGVFTNWVSGTTKANFGTGVSVGGATAGTFGPVTVNSATSLTANLKTSGATNGYRTVQIQTGAQTLTVNNGLFVETCNGTAPTILQVSPANGVTNVALNTVYQAQFSVPMSRSTFSLGNSGSTTIFFRDDVTGVEVPGTVSLDASGTIATITPSVALYAGRNYYVYFSDSQYIQDACGTNLGGAQFSFTTAFGENTTGPSLTSTSPENSDTNIALSGDAGTGTPVVLQFSSPVDPVTAQVGFSMTSGGNPVAGNFSYSTNDQTVTFTPVNPLTASTTYTVGYTNQITDYIGNALTNPGSFTFTTGTANDTTTPTVTSVDPPANQSNVGLNVMPRVTFSEPVNEVTIPGALGLYYEGNLIVAGTVTVAPNRMSATIAPSAALLPETEYEVYICGYSNIVGNNGSCFGSYFYTGTTNDTTHATVTAISPTASQTGVPLNAVVSAVMSSPIDPTTINNNSITVTPSGGSAIAGTVSLASDDVTLTFTPTAALTASKVYNVSVGGFNDIGGNSVTTFNSSFTTGSTSYGNGSFQVTTVSPVSGAVGVSVTSPVTFTMTNLIDPASVSGNTVYAYVSGGSYVIPGTYSVSSNQVTFTPSASSPYPANTTMSDCVYGLMDEAGNTDYQCYSFTTANTVDSTNPTVTISPANGAVNQGLNTQIVLTFSKAINPGTITTNSLALFNGDTSIGYNYSISRDSRTIILNPGGSAWTSGATITIELTTAIQDLSGNSLANTTSQFTLTTALPTTAPSVLAMRPGNGANNVPANAPITLFVSAPLNTSTIAGALNVTDNGIVISGTTQTTGNGQAILYTPSANFGAGDTIQVFLGSGALSTDGVPFAGFSGQFTVAGSLATTAAQVELVNPQPNAVGVPQNTTIQVEYNQPILGSSVTCTGSTGSVILYQYATGTFLTPNCSVSGNVISIQPTSNLVSGDEYEVYVDYGSNVTNTDGITVQAFSMNFYAGSSVDNTAPVITAEAPINNATNIGTNSTVSLTLNKAMNPISVTGSTILLTGGGITEVPSSMSFSPDFTHVSVVPQAPLPPSTVMTMKVSGVTSVSGKSVATTTTTFTTQALPDFTAPYVVSSSVLSGQANVPVNSVFSMTFSKAMDEGSFNPVDVNVYNGAFSSGVPATVSWSADQTTVFIVPTSALYVGTGYFLESYYMTDLEGNPETNFDIGFTTSFNQNTVAPTVVNTSPENSETAVPNNAPVEILFSEPIQPTSIGGITLTTGGNPVSVTPTWSDANQLLTLLPNSPLLQANATYTITITGVKDTAGNTMSGTVTNTFTTGSTFDLNRPTILSIDPANNTTGVGTNVAPRVVFSKRMNPLTIVSSSNEGYINDGSMELADSATNQWVPVTVSMDATRTIATITPNSALNPNTQYELYLGCSQSFYDVAGNYGGCAGYFFTTAAGPDTTSATVTAISPANTQTAVPLNAIVSAIMSDTIDPTTISSSSITVTPSGGSAIAGTVSLANDGVTLTFTPSSALTASKLYNVSVSGFKDVQGNTITTFTSSFTTGSTSYGNGSFQVTTVSPASGAVGVSVTSPVTFTMTNLIDPASVNANTVFAYVNGASYVVTGNYNVSGTTVTFTPLNPYPKSTLMQDCVYGLMDEAGNTDYQCYSFTTASTTDTTKPTVTITPTNGSASLGLNTMAVLNFSKSINPTTITSASVNMLNGDVPLNPSIYISRDSKTVTLIPSTLPAGATITVSASHLITDYSGNPLAADTTSQFTTTTAVSNSAPSVVSMRPGNGAAAVPTNSVISLFTSAPMNVSSLTGALYVSQNGVLISGSTTVGANGQNIAFTPSSALAPNTITQVFLNSTAQDIYGNYLSYFAGSFTTAIAESASSTAQVVTLNPFPSATSVPTNVVIQVEYNEPILSSSVTCNLGSGSSVTLYQYSTSSYLNPNCSVSGGVITIAPAANLVAGSQYQVYVSYATNVTNTDGSPVQPYAYNFTAGSGTDTAAPTILYVAPPNSATKIGTNAGVSVTFNKAINPVSVTGSTVKLSGGGITEVPSSISFSTDYKRLTITPQAPLPSSTTMTIAISGVTSEAGVAVTAQSPTFTTLAGPDLGTPAVVNTSVQNAQTVGTNASFAMQFNKPMDPGSVNPGGAEDVYLYDYTSATYVTANITFSADLTTVFLKPTANLTGSHQFELCSYYMTDLSGNPQNNYCLPGSFYSAASTITTGPSVVQVSPPSAFTSVPINAMPMILFSDYIDAASLGGVTLKQGGTVIPTTASTYDGDLGIELLPLAPLAPSTTYTINVTGVLDISGNAQSSFSPTSFTTGTAVDLTQPTWTAATCSGNPCSGASNVPDNTTVVVTFSKAMDPASFDPNNSFELFDTATSTIVPATITFNAGYTQATIQPNSVLAAATTYYMEISYQAYLYDLAGNRLGNGTYFSFTTH